MCIVERMYARNTELSKIFHVRMIVRWHTHMDFLIEREKKRLRLHAQHILSILAISMG